ncbi:hypothetical protein CGZ93_04820 [Enemella dayhoffiae]|uniref:DUF4244 domain-containing protein n=1 Tax=Enemella dayhoffiae TaxID=2016507 RepID=A0A255HAT6_9ACTN|nr:DUF4244 domain-containing protein [Enemella dayhoffiae]OYO24143.1 hypothetical protein CGZ93_04820 [Enemella dayhoffiae]
MSQSNVGTELTTLEPMPELTHANRRRRRRDERGAAAVEYAVVTVAAASIGGVLIKILTDPAIRDILLRLLMALIEHFMKLG